MEIHRLLKRQIHKTKPAKEPFESEYKDLFNLINNSYHYFDEEKKFNQRAVEISNEELKEINRELESQNAFLNSFNYGLAHDAKNHTANLKGLLSMFSKYKNSGNDEIIASITAKLELSVNQMSSIIDGFLFLSSMENSSGELNKQIDADDLEKMILLEIDYLLHEKEYSLDFNFNLDHLNYSPHILRVILVNLVSNSLKFSKRGTKVIVKAYVTKEKNFVKIKVTDNGIGMNLEDKGSTMFKLFDKRNKEAKEKGFGIGLFMIKRILDKNNGRIEINSKLRQGTEVSIFLPLIKN